MSKKAINVLLLVEDNPGDARLLREMLREESSGNTQLTEVASMREAAMHLKERAVDIVLLDLGLPDAQGLDAVRQARLAAPRVPLVVLTGLDDEALASQALQEGAQDYLIKGQIDARSLLRALRYAIERKNMEDALFAEKERAQVTLNCIGDAVACTDILGNLTFLNLVAEKLTGWSWQEAAAQPIAEVFQIVDTANREIIPNPMTKALERDRTVHLPSDSILVRRDGMEIPIEDSAAPIHDRDGRVTGAVIVFRDVSAARAMKLQTTRSAAYLAKQNTLLNQVNGELTALVRSSPIAIYATDPEGVVTMWSPAAERLSGFSHAEALGRFLPIVPEDAIEDVRNRIRRACQGEPASNVVFMARRKDGAMIELSISMGPLTDESGVARGAISLAENVTEAIAERKKIERMQSEFVSTVSHELRTPLTSIGGSLGLIVGGAAGVLNDRAARLIEIANNNTQRLIRLVNDILDIEKLQSGRMIFRFSPVRLDEIIDQAISANLAYAATFGIELRRLGANSNVVVKADMDRAIQAITNLISNAVKFSPANARVDISNALTTHGVRISVQDYGAGVPEEFRPRIFERFAQADSSDMRQRGGSGLGLSIVRQIMERHGGSVSFDSAPGAGARFHLDFPTLAGEDREKPRLNAHRRANRVLVCAVDPAVADPICATLIAHGFESALVVTAEDAISEAANSLLKAAVVDLPFAGVDPGDLIRRFRNRRGTEFPIIFVCVEPAIRDHFYVSQALPILAWVSRLAEVEDLPRAIDEVKAPSRLKKSVVLHVEDDRDLLEAVRLALSDTFRVVSASTLDAGRLGLARDRFDLVILDLGLSVDLVRDLFPAAPVGRPIPIILLTAHGATSTLPQGARPVSAKSRGGLATIVGAAASILSMPEQVFDIQEAQHEA